jgi:hypothetical protein
MPIVDIEFVGSPPAGFAASGPQALADTLGELFGSSPGRTWVRYRCLAAEAYAENHVGISANVLPVFVCVLKAHPPSGAALATEIMAVTRHVARVTGRPIEQVHVQYAPAAAGRQAFGGRLVE